RRRRLHPADRNDRLLRDARDDRERLRARGRSWRRGAEGLIHRAGRNAGGRSAKRATSQSGDSAASCATERPVANARHLAPDALGARMPDTEPWMGRHSAGLNLRPAASLRYGSGSGLPFFTSTAVTVARKTSANPTFSSDSRAFSGVALVAMPHGTPASTS